MDPNYYHSSIQYTLVESCSLWRFGCHHSDLGCEVVSHPFTLSALPVLSDLHPGHPPCLHADGSQHCQPWPLPVSPAWLPGVRRSRCKSCRCLRPSFRKPKLMFSLTPSTCLSLSQLIPIYQAAQAAALSGSSGRFFPLQDVGFSCLSAVSSALNFLIFLSYIRLKIHLKC